MNSDEGARKQFGNRILGQNDNVFKHNAWYVFDVKQSSHTSIYTAIRLLAGTTLNGTKNKRRRHWKVSRKIRWLP